MKTKNKKSIIYSKGGISHSKDSFEELVEKALPVISKMVNVEERIRIIREEESKKKDNKK